jgi:hypothetical protein
VSNYNGYGGSPAAPITVYGNGGTAGGPSGYGNNGYGNNGAAPAPISDGYGDSGNSGNGYGDSGTKGGNSGNNPNYVAQVPNGGSAGSGY